MRLVDADALIDNICGYAAPEMVWDRVDIVHKINEMPTIEERKTGKWIGVTPMVDTLMCSECEYNIINKEFKTPYCPNCGAKMEGEQNGV